MPYINIKITDEGVSIEQKQAPLDGATLLLVDVLDNNPKTTVFVIVDFHTNHRGLVGDPAPYTHLTCPPIIRSPT